MESESLLDHKTDNIPQIYLVDQKTALLGYGSRYTVYDETGLEVLNVKGRFSLIFPVGVIFFLILMIDAFVNSRNPMTFIIYFFVALFTFGILVQILQKLVGMNFYTLSFWDNTGRMVGKSQAGGTMMMDTWKISDISGQRLGTFQHVLKKRLGGVVKTASKEFVLEALESQYNVVWEKNKLSVLDEKFCYSISIIEQSGRLGLIHRKYKLELADRMDLNLSFLSAVTIIEKFLPPRSMSAD
ncbi:MAG: hypothetical protein ACFFAE_09255 [Candidatus Hodarchaeota archaeon]